MAVWIEDYVRVNEYTRPGYKLLGVRGIVVHYTATPGASAKNERDYFNGTCIEDERYASAHLFVDKNEARLILPLNEVAYHANEKACRVPALKATASYYTGGSANLTAIGVEMCIEKDGSLHPNTLQRTIAVVSELCKMFGLNSNNVYRHYDVTGKNCPAFWVSNPAGFTSFKNSLSSGGSGGGYQPTPQPPAETSDDGAIGYIDVIVDALNVRNDASFDAGVVKTIHPGTPYKVYAEKNGLYNLGGKQWCSAGSKFVKFTPYAKPKPQGFKTGDYQGKVRITADSLNVRAGRGVGHAVLGSFKQGQVVDVWYIAPAPDGSLWGSCGINGKTGFINLGFAVPA